MLGRKAEKDKKKEQELVVSIEALTNLLRRETKRRKLDSNRKKEET